jgi:hypothetical protein
MEKAVAGLSQAARHKHLRANGALGDQKFGYGWLARSEGRMERWGTKLWRVRYGWLASLERGWVRGKWSAGGPNSEATLR